VETRKQPDFLPKTWNLPEAIRKRLGTNAGRQRLMDEDGHLLVILHAPPKPEDDEVRHAFVLLSNPEGEWKSSPLSGGMAGLNDHLESYQKAIHELDDDVEAADSPRDYFEVMKRAHPLLRATRNMLAVLGAVRKARTDDQRLIVARDHAIVLERAIDMATGDAKVGMEFSMAMNAESQADATNKAGDEARRLNRLAAFFFPLATLVSIFGINSPREVLGMPGFWSVLATGVMAGLLTGALIMGKKRNKAEPTAYTSRRPK
jgi:hypothetical protein